MNAEDNKNDTKETGMMLRFKVILVLLLLILLCCAALTYKFVKRQSYSKKAKPVEEAPLPPAKPVAMAAPDEEQIKTTWTFDPVTVKEVKVQTRDRKDRLNIEVAYSGGCKEHTFDLIVANEYREESLPGEMNLYLAHQSNGDSCEAFISETLAFDLTPLMEVLKVRQRVDGMSIAILNLEDKKIQYAVRPDDSPPKKPIITKYGRVKTDWIYDPVKTPHVWIEGDTMHMVVEYKGGCKKHDFDLIVVGDIIIASAPPQLYTIVSHRANGDTCTAPMSEKIAFDIKPIQGVQMSEVFIRMEKVYVFSFYDQDFSVLNKFVKYKYEDKSVDALMNLNP